MLLIALAIYVHMLSNAYYFENISFKCNIRIKFTSKTKSKTTKMEKQIHIRTTEHNISTMIRTLGKNVLYC